MPGRACIHTNTHTHTHTHTHTQVHYPFDGELNEGGETASLHSSPHNSNTKKLATPTPAPGLTAFSSSSTELDQVIASPRAALMDSEGTKT